ncbi:MULTISPECIES: ABC transporter ATP-binding protein [Nitrospirillum]|uniref:Amino acid/amide ABC transporter ATP-binding protein 2 (HAAT family) n=1 Tax=Nitrospirillum amazonense TaxID=28077 RepID=A0A560FHJ6_9PROT|nr:ABC transporter ATP-binding protein [Nitrospirillum amazonense]MEC4590524.1 ABC transporter ATP-binding protein [Nitrospirillum amazonense]TWB21078.1 amino acid/amide ABC transporter ATP-binding protein 2 (HAAT family) [Nitrospirillum amazonense]
MPETVLSVTGLDGHYGESHVLHGVDFSIRAGEVVTLVGRNGAGKTSTLRAIMGMLPRRSGSIELRGRQLISLPPHRIARAGIGYVPDDRGIFASLSVAENLALPPRARAGALSDGEIDALFPRLKERRASPGTKLSGGEQQMLAIARALRTGADLLLLDEPTEGLAPVIVRQIGAILRDLKGRGHTVLLVEQNVHFAATVADRHIVMENGRVVDSLDNAELAADPGRLDRFLGV